jgi:hypothetical protein
MRFLLSDGSAYLHAVETAIIDHEIIAVSDEQMPLAQADSLQIIKFMAIAFAPART